MVNVCCAIFLLNQVPCFISIFVERFPGKTSHWFLQWQEALKGSKRIVIVTCDMGIALNQQG